MLVSYVKSAAQQCNSTRISCTAASVLVHFERIEGVPLYRAKAFSQWQSKYGAWYTPVNFLAFFNL